MTGANPPDRRRLPLLAALMLAIVAACSPFSAMDQGAQTVDGAFVIEPSGPWSLYLEGDDGMTQAWTRNGPRLDVLLFILNVPDNTVLLGGDNPPVFRAGMTEVEIVEAVADGLTQLGMNRVEFSDIRPADFGTLPGFRAQLSLVTDGGLAKRGLLYGSSHGGVLHLMLFHAAELHYYDAIRPDVERMFRSIRIL